MSSEDIASQLLHSTDARIAEAAKRVFSSSYNPASGAAVSRSSSSMTLPTYPYYYEGGENDRSAIGGAVATGSGKIRDSVHEAEYAGGLKRPISATTRPSDLNDNAEDEDEKSSEKLSSTERLQRSRERNRMHARKTRQRKKEHMQKLQNRADELKLEQIRLRQAINEKNTASILVGLFQSEPTSSTANNDDVACHDHDGGSDDPRVDALLKRKVEDIPDASKIPELPALILPGQHSNKKKSSSEKDDTSNINSSSKHQEQQQTSTANANAEHEAQEDGIDYELLGKDRAACSPAELDKIRRERNRMHAKRTRDRKRIFMEEMEVMIRQLEEENALLQDHVDKIYGRVNVNAPENATSSSTHAISPLLSSAPTPMAAPVPVPLSASASTYHSYTEPPSSQQPPQAPPPQPSSSRGDFLNQIESLLAAAGAFEKRRSVGEINAISCAESDVTASTNNSEHNSLCGDEMEEEEHCCKKQRLLEENVPTSVPSSITTTKLL